MYLMQYIEMIMVPMINITGGRCPPSACGESRLFGKVWICEFSQCNVKLFICINLVGLLLGNAGGRAARYILLHEAFNYKYRRDFASTMYKVIYK